MRSTWIFLLALGVAAADVSSLGYHYKVPETSYGVPSYQIGGNSGQYSSGYSSSVGSGSNVAYQGTGYQNAGLQSASNGLYQSAGAISSATAVPAYLYGNGGLGTGYQTQYSSSSQYQTAENYQQHYEIQQQPAQVFKHFYVHTAPEEPEPPKPRTPIVLPPPQKHYKIIFVKTPTEHQRQQTVVPVQPQNEEKTIVYVLVKKPEEPKEVVVPKIEQKPPSKPEVFFIKYKNKEDSEAVINNIVKDYNQNGQQVSVLNPGLGDSSYNGISGLNDVVYNSGPVVNDVAYSSVSGVNDVSYNSGAALSDVTYNSGAALSDGTYNSGAALSDVTYNSGAALSDVAYNSGTGLSDVSYSTVSDAGYGNLPYDTGAQNVVSSNSNFVLSENQGSTYSLSSANSGSDLSEGTVSSTIASPVTVSTTASSLDYDGASAIATSQGVPHEAYGPPKFREN